MNKLLKRALMLGTLVVCLATAAWAGNVEVSWVGGNIDCSVNPAAEGYYQNSMQYFYLQSADDKVNFDKNDFEYYFDANGNMTWGQWSDGSVIYRNDYDKNGNLIRSVSTGDDSVTDTEIETFTYDSNGLLTQSRYYSSIKGGSAEEDNTYYYTYGNNQITVKAYCSNPYGDSVVNYVYTLDGNGNVVKLTYKNETAGYDYSGTKTFTYDARGNLTKSENVGTGLNAGGKYLFEYNDQDLCVKETFVNAEGYENATTYKYDENGNAIEEVHYNSWGYNYTYAPIPQSASQSDFSDVSANAFYTSPVIWATETGITKGTTETTFSPNQGCTRAQMVTFLWRAAGSPEPKSNNNPFTDVKQGAYYKAILWAVEKGITNGTTATTFSPNATCTRAQIVTFIYRAAGEPAVKNSTNPFQDVKQGAYYKAILWAVENGVTTGFTANTFAPNSTCTRGQGVTFLYRGIGLY